MPIRALLTFLLLVVSLSAAQLEGTWAARVTNPDGHVNVTYYTFHQNGTELTGTVTTTNSDQTIRQGKVDGDRFSFVLQYGDPAKPRVVPVEGNIVGSTLHLKTSPPNRPVLEADAAPADPNLAKPPAKLPLPALKDLPPNKLAKLPPMGWNSWNRFQGKVDDKTIREIADAVSRNGMRAAGYLYINIDDTWQGERDAQGRIHANSKFPDMKSLTDYVHKKDLLIGIYSSPGPKTCAGYEGSYGHEQQDAETYAEWGFDYLKYDWCSAGRIYQDSEMQAAYQKMGEFLQAQPRPIVYSLCQYGRAEVWKWGPKVGANLWRTTGDIRDAWDSMTEIGFRQGALAPYAGPGHWNDPDMLEIGNGGMTDDEYRVHMTLWSMLAAPLLAGNDVREMPKKTLDMLVNKEVIEIDRDPLGKQGTQLAKHGDQEVWTKPLAKGAVAVALFNRGDASAEMSIKWSDLLKTQRHLIVRDAWRHEFVKVTGNDQTWSVTVPKHGVVLLRISTI